MRIPIPDLLQRLRREAKHDAQPGHEPLAGQGRPRVGSRPLPCRALLSPPLTRASITPRPVSPVAYGADAKASGLLDPVPRSPQTRPQSLHALLRQKKKES